MCSVRRGEEDTVSLPERVRFGDGGTVHYLLELSQTGGLIFQKIDLL